MTMHTVEEYVDVMLRYKVEPCKDPACEKGWMCFGYHNPNERRRPPRGRLTDKAKKCPDLTSGPHCPRGEACPFFHTMTEWFHPSAYKRGHHPEGETVCRVVLRQGDPLFCSFMHESDDKKAILRARTIALERSERSAAAGGSVSTLLAIASAPLPETGEAKRKARDVQRARETEEWREIDERNAFMSEFPELSTVPGATESTAAGKQSAGSKRKEKKKHASADAAVTTATTSSTTTTELQQQSGAARSLTPTVEVALPAPSPSPSKAQQASAKPTASRYTPILQSPSSSTTTSSQQPQSEQQQQTPQLPAFFSTGTEQEKQQQQQPDSGLDGPLEDEEHTTSVDVAGNGLFGEPVLLRGVVTMKDVARRIGRVTTENKSFVFHEYSLISLGWPTLREGDEIMIIPEPSLSETMFPDVFAWCMVGTQAKGAPPGPYLTVAMAKSVLTHAWQKQLLVVGIAFRTPERRLDLRPFAILRTATMRDLRAKIAALTGIPGQDQVISATVGEDRLFVLPDEDDRRLEHTPLISGVGPDVTLMIRNESRLVRWARFDNMDADLRSLAAITSVEYWGDNFEVLLHYIKKTFAASLEQNLLAWGYDDAEEGAQQGRTPTLACFNTALLTPTYDPIYGVFEVLPENVSDLRHWRFQSWENERTAIKYFSALPQPPEFFKSPLDLVFQPKQKFLTNIDQILADQSNRRQLEESFRNLGVAEQLQRRLFSSALTEMKRRIKQNFRIAIPYFNDGCIGFYLPLTLGDADPDAVHAVLSVQVTKAASNGAMVYIGHTLVPLVLAYMNARLVAPPSANWLCDSIAPRGPRNVVQLNRMCLGWGRLVESTTASAPSPTPQSPADVHAAMIRAIQMSVIDMLQKTYACFNVGLPQRDVQLLSVEFKSSASTALLFAKAAEESIPDTGCPSCGNAIIHERDPDNGEFTIWRCPSCGLSIKS